MSIVYIILLASNIPPFTAGIFALLNFKKFDRRLYAFKIFLLFNCLIQITQLILSTLKRNNLFLLHIGVPVEFVLLTLFYYAVFKRYLDKKIAFGLIFSFTGFSVFNSIFIQPIDSFNSNALITEALILITISIFSFIILLDPRSGMNKEPFGKCITLINSGIFINLSTTLLIYYFSNYLIKNVSKNLVNYIWVYNDLASVIMYTCFILAIWKHIKRT